MKLIIIRHAEPDYSIDSLTPKGWREAEMLSERLMKINPDRLFCSPMGRAKDTAKPYLEKSGKTVTVCDWLHEFTGHWYNEKTGESNKSWDQLPSVWTEQKDYYNREKWAETSLMATGDIKEKYDWVAAGIDSLLAELGYRKDGDIYRVERANKEKIVLFCHFAVECVILSRILNISPVPLWHQFVALPSSVTVLNTEEREEGIAVFRCSGFGDLSHLYANDEPESFAARFCEVYTDGDRH